MFKNKSANTLDCLDFSLFRNNIFILFFVLPIVILLPLHLIALLLLHSCGSCQLRAVPRKVPQRISRPSDPRVYAIGANKSRHGDMNAHNRLK